MTRIPTAVHSYIVLSLMHVSGSNCLVGDRNAYIKPRGIFPQFNDVNGFSFAQQKQKKPWSHRMLKTNGMLFKHNRFQITHICKSCKGPCTNMNLVWITDVVMNLLLCTCASIYINSNTNDMLILNLEPYARMQRRRWFIFLHWMCKCC